MNYCLPFIFLVILTGSCIQRLDVPSIDQEVGTLVVDGQITDAPGPYQVKLFRASASDASLNSVELLRAKQITLFDDAGESEILIRTESGIYETDPNGIRGKVGRKYAIRIEMLDGSVFESEPDEMLPAGSVDSLYYRWESVKPIQGATKNGFRIFMNASSSDQQTLLRWRFTGIYVLETFPQLRRANDANCSNTPPPPDPPPCSGWRYIRNSPINPIAGGILEQFSEECTCCTCWIPDAEKKPSLSDEVISTDGKYKEIEMGYVPFNQWTFGMGKYMVKVEQMSLTKKAYEFWKIFKDQKDGAASLFQPAFGRTKTNLFSTQGDVPVMGIFYASAVRTKVIFITPADAPVDVPPYDFDPTSENCALWSDCRALNSFPNGSATPPPEWQ